MGSIPLSFPLITCMKQFTGVHLRTSQKPAPNIYDHVQTYSEDFPKILENHKNIWKLLLNHFWSFLKISEDFPKILKNLKSIGKHFWTVSKVFQMFPKIAKDFPKFS